MKLIDGLITFGTTKNIEGAEKAMRELVMVTSVYSVISMVEASGSPDIIEAALKYRIKQAAGTEMK